MSAAGRLPDAMKRGLMKIIRSVLGVDEQRTYTEKERVWRSLVQRGSMNPTQLAVTLGCYEFEKIYTAIEELLHDNKVEIHQDYRNEGDKALRMYRAIV